MASLWRTFLSTFIFKSVVSFIHSHVILNLYEFIYLMESKWKDNQTQMFEPIDFHCMDKIVTGLERYTVKVIKSKWSPFSFLGELSL